jgi:hypothetical protein
MSVHRAVAALAVVGLLSLVSVLPADTPMKEGTSQDDKQVVDSKVSPKVAAAAVNFRQQLGLPFPSLGTLGTRIDAARRAHDPVSLANASSELAVAEKVAGKKASITSTQLFNESVELARMRRKEKELQALVRISNQVEVQEDNIALLQNSLKLAKEDVQQKILLAAQNTEPTWTPRTVVVNNYTTQYLDFYVNGNYKVQVAPGMQQTFLIEHRWNPTVLTAYGDSDVNTWGPRYIWGQFSKYTWNVN